MSDGTWTTDQVRMFAEENAGRICARPNGTFQHLLIGDITREGFLVSAAGSVPPMGVVFADGLPERAPMATDVRYCRHSINDQWVCTRPVGHPPTVHVAHIGGVEITGNPDAPSRWPVEPTEVRNSIYNLRDLRDQHESIFPAIGSHREWVDAHLPLLDRPVPKPRSVAEKRAAFAEAAGAPAVAQAARDEVFFAGVDELLRWAQGRADRDTERDRICRALGPMLRERQGKVTR